MKKIFTFICVVVLLCTLLVSCAGASVVGAFINSKGELLLEMSDGTFQNVGVVKGADGEKGDKGDTGEKGDRGDVGPMGEKGDNGDVVEKLDTHLIAERVLEHTVRVSNCNSLGVEVSSGSGVIYAKNEGVYTVITNDHVIKGASQIKVKCYDGKEYTASVRIKSTAKDIAVLEFTSNQSAYPGAFQGDSKTITRGQDIFVAGNPVGNEFVVSFGYISNPSSFGRWNSYDVQDVIVLDASVNHGNSGGGVYDELGRLIGIVTAKAGGETDGIGYAIPMYTVNEIVDADIGLEELFGKPTLGIKVTHINSPELYEQRRNEYEILKTILPNLSSEEEQKIYYGVYVVDTLDSVLQKGDRIISIDGKAVVHYNDVSEILSVYTPGANVEILVKRIETNGTIKEHTIQATLSAIPD